MKRTAYADSYLTYGGFRAEQYFDSTSHNVRVWWMLLDTELQHDNSCSRLLLLLHYIYGEVGVFSDRLTNVTLMITHCYTFVNAFVDSCRRNRKYFFAFILYVNTFLIQEYVRHLSPQTKNLVLWREAGNTNGPFNRVNSAATLWARPMTSASYMELVLLFSSQFQINCYINHTKRHKQNVNSIVTETF